MIWWASGRGWHSLSGDLPRSLRKWVSKNKRESVHWISELQCTSMSMESIPAGVPHFNVSQSPGQRVRLYLNKAGCSLHKTGHYSRGWIKVRLRRFKVYTWGIWYRLHSTRSFTHWKLVYESLRVCVNHLSLITLNNAKFSIGYVFAQSET